MKRKITSVLLFVAVLCFVALPVADAAKETIKGGESTIYGAISKERIESADDSEGFETNNIYITKSSGSYIYLTFTPAVNVKEIVEIEPASGFKMISNKKTDSNGYTVLLESTSGKVTKDTKILTMILRQDKIGDDCNVAVTPLNLNCTSSDGKYFIADGTEVTEEEYNQVCSNVEPPKDVQTGIPVPYIAVAGGILAIAGVYLYSRKQNKMFKI